MKVHLAFRPDKFREPMLKAATQRAMMRLGWQESTLADCDVAMWWGIPPTHKKIIKVIDGIKPYLIFDYPYWGRLQKPHIKSGYYKISLNGINPIDYLEMGGASEDRYLKSCGPKIKDWIRGDKILIAGMGPKSCESYGFFHGAWDGEAVKEIKKHTDRQIIYRQKPSDKTPNRYGGTVFDNGKTPINEVFKQCHIVVTHHGNSTTEALAMGIPGLTKYGMSKSMGITDFSQIENPIYPSDEERLAFLSKVSMWQWHYDEIKRGDPFIHLFERGLIGRL